MTVYYFVTKPGLGAAQFEVIIKFYDAAKPLSRPSHSQAVVRTSTPASANFYLLRFPRLERSGQRSGSNRPSLLHLASAPCLFRNSVNTNEQARVEKEELEVDDAEQDGQEAVTDKEMAGLIHGAQYRC